MTDAAGDALAEMRTLTRKVTELVDQVKTEGKVVETLVHETSSRKAEREAFWRLFDYIQGKNQGDQKIAMTAPAESGSPRITIPKTAA